MNLNIGGGAFSAPGWINLDQRTGFRFTPGCVFPLPDRQSKIGYSSHALEHMDDATVDRVLSEARRVCDGMLVLKLPDFEEVLRRYHAGDHDYFRQWGMDKVAHLWESDTITKRAAMIFCGWWNEAYGNEWGKRQPNAEGAYHGPAILAPSEMDDILATSSPHAISHMMKRGVPKNSAFNHQNAWSRAELAQLLIRHGFEVTTMDADKICTYDIPGIQVQASISMYVACR